MFEEMWCNACDNRIVDINKPESGTFYRAHGHDVFTKKAQFVVFAICKDCQIKDGLRELTKEDFE